MPSTWLSRYAGSRASRRVSRDLLRGQHIRLERRRHRDNFRALWGNSFVFGTNLGSYGGGGVGLSTGPGDAVSIFDASGAPQAFVSFLLSPTHRSCRPSTTPHC